MHYGDVSVFDLEHHDLAHADGVVVVGQKQNVSPLKSRFHRATAGQAVRGIMKIEISVTCRLYRVVTVKWRHEV